MTYLCKKGSELQPLLMLLLHYIKEKPGLLWGKPNPIYCTGLCKSWCHCLIKPMGNAGPYTNLPKPTCFSLFLVSNANSFCTMKPPFMTISLRQPPPWTEGACHGINVFFTSSKRPPSTSSKDRAFFLQEKWFKMSSSHCILLSEGWSIARFVVSAIESPQKVKACWNIGLVGVIFSWKENVKSANQTLSFWIPSLGYKVLCTVNLSYSHHGMSRAKCHYYKPGAPAAEV